MANNLGEIKDVARALQVYLTPSMLMKPNYKEVSNTLVQKALAEGHKREEIERAM